MTQETAQPLPEPRELAGLVQSFARHLRVGCAIVLGCIALAAVAALVLPKRYTAEALLAYQPQAPLARGGGELPQTDAQRDAAIDAQLDLIASLPVAEQAAQSVDPGANPALEREAEASAARSERRLGRAEALGAALLDHVKARRVGQTPVFAVAVSAESAPQAARIANLFAASYLKAAMAQKAGAAADGADELAARLAPLRQETDAATARLAAFRLAHHLLENADSSTLEQGIATLRGQLADARGQAALAGTRSASADSATVVGGGYGGSVDTTPVSGLSQQRAAAAAELAALLGRYGEKYPDVIAAREKLAAVDGQLVAAMHGNRNAASAEARATTARATALAGSLDAAEARLAAALAVDAQLRDLQNSALAARQAYQDTLKLDADQAAQRALLQPDARIIAPAAAPLRPHSPRMEIAILFGLISGLIVAIGVAFVRESWVHRLGSVEDVVRWLDRDYFTPLPRLAGSLRNRDPDAALPDDPHSALAGAYRSLGISAWHGARPGQPGCGRVIGITAALPGEGTTTAAIAVGRLLALDGMRVALVDADLRGGAGIRARAGEVARDAAGLGHKPAIDRSGLARFTRSGHDASGFAPFIAALRQDYEMVFIEVAPILSGHDLRPFLPSLDALILLARWRRTPVRVVREALRRIEAAGGQVTGVALSMVEGMGRSHLPRGKPSLVSR